jgi:hypothetical protein
MSNLNEPRASARAGTLVRPASASSRTRLLPRSARARTRPTDDAPNFPAARDSRIGQTSLQWFSNVLKGLRGREAQAPARGQSEPRPAGSGPISTPTVMERAITAWSTSDATLDPDGVAYSARNSTNHAGNQCGAAPCEPHMARRITIVATVSTSSVITARPQAETAGIPAGAWGTPAMSDRSSCDRLPSFRVSS